MENIDVLKRKGNSYVNIKDLRKIKLSKKKDTNLTLNKRPFKTNILVLNNNKNHHHLINKNNTKIIGNITQQLLLCGYSMECIKYCYEKYKFNTIEKALNIIMKDNLTGKYNHDFYSISKYQKLYGKIIIDVPENEFDTTCFICKDIEKYHINYHEKESFDDKSKNIKNSKFPFFSNNQFVCNSFSILNQKSKNDEKIKLGNYEHRDSAKSYFPYIQININLINSISKSFQGKNDLCLICYTNELNENNSFKMECGHKFCFDCYKHYIKDKIENGIIKIKCLMAGCLYEIPDKIIKRFTTQELFRKYLKFKKNSLYYENLKKGLIPCIHPDCEEWIKYNENDDPNVTCKEGHSFCAKCKQKQHKGKRCTIFERNLNKDSRIKPCPNCNYLIEKNNNDNKTICPMCNYTFCWLCLNNCSIYHYYIFNIRGCPCLRYADPKESKILNNSFIQFLLFCISFILTIITFAIIICLYLFFGASYELIKLYNKKKDNDYDFGNDVNLTDYDFNIQGNNTFEINNTRVNNSLNGFIQRVPNDVIKEKTCDKENYCIYILLFLTGIILQPFFLVYKFLQTMMECYKNFGCWFFYMGNW